MEIDFNADPEEQQLALAKPELLMPTGFDLKQTAMRQEMQAVVRYSAGIVDAGIISIEEHEKAIEAGRLLQVMTKNITDFYKPIKQMIDRLKQPILDMEHADSDAVKIAKESLASAIQDFEHKQAEAEAARLQEALAAAPKGAEGELPMPVIVQATMPAKTRGKVDRTRWDSAVVDFPKLVHAVDTSEVPIAALLPNQRYLDKRADADREGFSIPGVIARKTEKIHFRA
jgi:hypothetical protein